MKLGVPCVVTERGGVNLDYLKTRSSRAGRAGRFAALCRLCLPRAASWAPGRRNSKPRQLGVFLPALPDCTGQDLKNRRQRATGHRADEGGAGWSQSATPTNLLKPLRTTERRRQEKTTGQPKPRDIQSGCSTRGMRGQRKTDARSATSTLDCHRAHIRR